MVAAASGTFRWWSLGLWGGGLRGFLLRYLEKLKWDLCYAPTIRLNEVGFALSLGLIFQLHGATETLGGLW